jgi:hypothetical protein
MLLQKLKAFLNMNLVYRINMQLQIINNLFYEQALKQPLSMSLIKDVLNRSEKTENVFQKLHPQFSYVHDNQFLYVDTTKVIRKFIRINFPHLISSI